jgi:putative polyketide hydroxylase
MPSTDTSEVPVLVAGAGPAGLATALELARHDVGCLLVERRSELSSHPRATVLSLRSMESVRAWGLEAAVRARSADVDWRMLLAETLADAAAGTAMTVGYPSPEQSAMLSPTAPACIAQDEVEPLLLERLRAAPHARIALGTELTGVLVGPDGVRARLRDLATGASRTVHARFLVAADGARSAVRGALGIPLCGPERVMEGFTTVVRAPLWDVVGEHRHVIYSLSHPAAPAAFVPTGPSDRWLFGLGGTEVPGEREIARLLRLTAGVPGLPLRIERSQAWSSAAQIAVRWRSGPVFLAGDAAHRVTPRGGTGLNLALHDGADLGRRLGWVLRGWDGPALLDGYEAERRPVAEHTVARSADPSGSLRPVETEVRADLGGRIAHAWEGRRSPLDLFAPGLTLFAARGEGGWDGAAAALATRAPVTVRLVDPLVARAVGAPAGSALVARSDGVPVAVLHAGAGPLPERRVVAGAPS